MNGYDWTCFTVRININRSIADIYGMWNTPAAIENWFLRSCEIKKNGLLRNGTSPIAAGDEYSWRWHGYPDEVVEHGEILEANGTDLLRFTFGQEDGKPMVCTVKIYPAEGENLCEITQENIPDNEKGKSFYHIGCMAGWSFYLANMKSILEGGIDLRNRNEKLTKMINA